MCASSRHKWSQCSQAGPAANEMAMAKYRTGRGLKVTVRLTTSLVIFSLFRRGHLWDGLTGSDGTGVTRPGGRFQQASVMDHLMAFAAGPCRRL